jgi:signal transduction histidine kinase
MTEKRIALEKALLRAQKLESIGILARGLAHDFNNLLTSIRGNISIMKKCLNPENEVYEDLKRIENGSNRAKDLVQQYLSFARGKAPVKDTTSVAKLITDSVDKAKSYPNINFDLSIPDDIRPVKVDPEQISRVINNMIHNARDAMPEGGAIHIGLENFAVTADNSLPIKEGEYIRISLKDDGRGISEENLDNIFDPYFTTKELGTQKGMGFGLAVCYTLIKDHEGLITVESKQDDGTTFYIYLPAQDKAL